MSQQNSANLQEPKVVQKQQLNVYTVMLLVAFVAICIANLLLYLELRRWGSFPWWRAKSGAGAATSYIYETEAPPLPTPKLQGASSQMWS